MKAVSIKAVMAKMLENMKAPLIVRTASVSVPAKNGNAYITAPTVSGYTFLLWFGTYTSGWVGGVYNSLPTSQQGRVWTLPTNTQTGNGTVVSCALYIRSDLA